MFKFKRKPRRPPRAAHEVWLWTDEGTGCGDGGAGWRCTCGVWHLNDYGLDEHLEMVQRLAALNAALAVTL